MLRIHHNFNDDHPDPMWVFDAETLRFLDVNRAAVVKYGYSTDEFLHMTIADIRPLEDVTALRAAVAKLTSDSDDVGRWRHVLKSGKMIDVSVTACSVNFQGRPAKLAAIRDITQIVELEQKVRRTAAKTEQQFAQFFEAVPGKCVIISVGTYEILAASDAYLAARGVNRRQIIGRKLFEVFTDSASDTAANGIENLTASFRRIEATGVPDILPLQRYTTEQKDGGATSYIERFWSVVNTPVLAEDGSVNFIVHRVEEMTQLVNAVRAAGLDDISGNIVEAPILSLSLEVIHRAEELKAANIKLTDQAANLRTAQRLLALGFFRLDVIADKLMWSENIYDLFGVDKANFNHDTASYFDLVDPRDRDTAAALLDEKLALGNTTFEFSHRILRPSGGVISIKGVCEIVQTSDQRTMTGVFQDVTTQIVAEAERQRSITLARFAGHLAKLGGWRVDLYPMKIHWTPETAEIHELPDMRSPGLEEALNFFVPEFRGTISAALQKCIDDGLPFDELLEMITAQGNRIWVRSIGEAQRDADGTIVAVQGAFQNVSEIVAMRQTADLAAMRLAKTVDGMSEAFVTIDKEWRFSFMNIQAEKILGRGRADLLGKFVWAEFPSGHGGIFEPELEIAVRAQTSVRFKAFYPEPLNGWFDVCADPIPEGLAVYFRDVTEDHANTHQLRLLEKSVSQISDIVIITEATTLEAPNGPKIVFVNESFCRQTGFTAEEAIGKTPRILQGSRTDEATLAKIRKGLEVGQHVTAELINYTKGGAEYWTEIEMNPVTDQRGTLTHYVSVQRNITERKIAEQALRASDERFMLLANTSNIIIKDIDLITQKVWLTTNMHQYFGEMPKSFDAFLHIWREKIHPDDVDWVMASFNAARSNITASWQDHYRLITPNGATVIVSDRANFIRNELGEPIRIIGSLVDVTAQEEELAHKRQSQKLEAMGQLIGGVAHDFNNMLTIILGNSEIMMQNSMSEEQRKLAETTTKAAEHAASLTGRLLAFARRHPLEPKPIAVNHLITSMNDLLRRSIAENVEIILNLSDDVGQVRVDASQLEVSLLNLALNARHAMPGGGKLIIETSKITIDQPHAAGNSDFASEEYVLLAVTDTGTGMAPQVAERVFEPFFTTKEVGLGSGLGLSMVYGFVNQSGGKISVYSEIGIGTTFKLYLPCIHEKDTTAVEVLTRSEIVGGTEHILVVEDDISVREHLVDQLEWLGYQVCHATNSKEALIILQARDDIDLLLTDVVMPGGMDGPELAIKATILHRDLKILYTSGYTRNAIVLSGLLDPDVELLSKPYRRQDLASKLRKLLDR